jgi:spore coat polysaccharide biosynthesis protein SpsF
MSSSRLPGKVLMDLGGRPVLSWVIQRARRAKCLDALIVATSSASDDEPIATLARVEGVDVYRGSLEDVLGRFIGAAEAVSADVVVRLTGDSPFLEPTYLRTAVDRHFAAGSDLTCARNPDQIVPGTGCEVVNLTALRWAAAEGHSREDREHVTWYLLANQDRFKVEFFQAKEGWQNPGFRLTVDEAEDLALVRAIHASLAPENSEFGLGEILSLYQREPQVFEVNRKVQARPHLFRKMSAQA